MGAQDFFDQMKVLERQPELLGAGDEKIEFVRRVGLRPAIAQNQTPDQGLLAGNRDRRDLLQSFPAEDGQRLLAQFGSGHDQRTSGGRNALGPIVQFDGGALLEKLRGKANLLKNREPRSID